MKVVVAMSGGVDSSVAAALLKSKGFQVIGVTMQMAPSDKQIPAIERSGGRFGLGTAEDAKKIAYQLNIPHYMANFRDIFAEKVIGYFCREYGRGRTPNPCIRCNRYIKFDALVQRARELGADFIATGHYARIQKDEGGGRYLLKKGVDRRKDQSYVLYTATQEQLSHTLLPVGEYTKERVREIAGELGLPVATRQESQEICFIPDNDYPRFIKERFPLAATPGPILDKEGNILGEHRGVAFYTIGQRKRLGISARNPLYVIAIHPEENAIVAGSKEETYGDELVASDPTWVAIERLRQPIEAKVKIRYLHKAAEALITPLDNDKIHVRFKKPQMAITPGQAAVLYDDDSVVGGGIIE